MLYLIDHTLMIEKKPTFHAIEIYTFFTVQKKFESSKD